MRAILYSVDGEFLKHRRKVQSRKAARAEGKAYLTGSITHPVTLAQVDGFIGIQNAIVGSDIAVWLKLMES